MYSICDLRDNQNKGDCSGLLWLIYLKISSSLWQVFFLLVMIENRGFADSPIHHRSYGMLPSIHCYMNTATAHFRLTKKRSSNLHVPVFPSIFIRWAPQTNRWIIMRKGDWHFSRCFAARTSSPSSVNERSAARLRNKRKWNFRFHTHCFLRGSIRLRLLAPFAPIHTQTRGRTFLS